jgi:hypothetical protein
MAAFEGDWCLAVRRAAMWQVDNDRYTLWRLEHEVGVKRIDRLLNSVTETDRTGGPLLGRLDPKPLAGVLDRFLRRLCSRTAMGPIVPRASE